MVMGSAMTESKTLNKRRRVRRSEAEWRELFTRFDHSGQTREAFCAAHGVVVSSFMRWRRKLRPVSRRPPAVVYEPVFVELAAEREAPHWDVELELGAGVVVRLRQSAC
jgi:hypothetical protein